MVDANILIAGSVWPRWPYEVLQHALREDFKLVLCNYIIQQARLHILRRFPLHLEQFDSLLPAFHYEEIPNPTLERVSLHRNLVRDPTDIPVALAAIDGNVDHLVSEDKDLTIQDETTARLRQRLSVMISGTFLRQVMGWKSDDLERIRHRTWQDIQRSDGS